MNIGIVGLGIIGGSMAGAIKKNTEHKVYAKDINPAAIERDMLLGYVDGELTDQLLSQCDYVIIAVYPKVCAQVMTELAPLISPKATVVDCCGTKREICQLGHQLSEKYGWTFIGGHPMAGKEIWGYAAANANLFNSASMILTPMGDIDIAKLADAKNFFVSAGFGYVTVRTPEEHDRIIAYTSQLAHVLSSAYVMCPTARDHRGLSAGSFRDMTRVAVINGQMWSDIFIENKDFLIPEIDRLIRDLTDYRQAIVDEDRSKLVDMMNHSTEIKREISKPGPRRG